MANGLGLFVYKDQQATGGKWRIQAVVNNGVDKLAIDALSDQLREGVNGCEIKAFTSGKLHISFRVHDDHRLQLYYTTFFSDDSSQMMECFISDRYPQMYYQGFFGLTAMNMIDKPAANDIDIKMVEFYNLDPNSYQGEVEKLAGRDYFRYDKDAYGLPGDAGTSSLDTTAHDLLRMKRDIEEAEKKEISQDLSNVAEGDSFEEVVFKIFEQMKGYNNRLSEFNKGQRELLRDLKELEHSMQKDEDYTKLKEELAFAESSIQELEAKLAMLNAELGKAVD